MTIKRLSEIIYNYFTGPTREKKEQKKIKSRTNSWKIDKLCRVYCSNCFHYAPKDSDDEYICTEYCPYCKAKMSNGNNKTLVGIIGP